jgi:hypothetical protein
MRKIIMILGTLLISTILFSGPVVAPPVWHYGVTIPTGAWQDVYMPHRILGAPDGRDCALYGNSSLGDIFVNLSYGHEMGASQSFRVFASSAVYEEYYVWVSETLSGGSEEYMGVGDDTQNSDFTTPSKSTSGYLYIHLTGKTHNTGPGDMVDGADIDAVGWFG